MFLVHRLRRLRGTSGSGDENGAHKKTNRHVPGKKSQGTCTSDIKQGDVAVTYTVVRSKPNWLIVPGV